MKRIDIRGLQVPSTGLPVEAIVSELCSTKNSTDRLIILMKQVLDEIKGLRSDIKKGIEKANDGIGKADQVIERVSKAANTLERMIENG